MTARTQAREVALQKSGPLGDAQDFMDGADAASDTWEPLVRAALEQMEQIVVIQASPQQAEWFATIERLREALDD